MIIDADLLELDHAALVLHRVAGELAALAPVVPGLAALAPEFAAVVPGVGAVGPGLGAGWGLGSGSAAEVRAVVGEVLGRAAALDALARRVRATALGYRAADAAGALATAAVLRALTGPLSPVTGIGAAVAGVERLLSLGGAVLRESSRVAVTPRPVPWPGPLGGAAGVLGRSAGLHVEELATHTGRAWVVTIPGTSDWSPMPGRTPFDLTGDVRLMAGETSAGQAAVLAALRAVGARRGEPVMLAGHSQGGLIAASLAARPDVRSQFTITQVVTTGAPIALIDLPRSVNTLSIEHTDDVVPKADGRANPVRRGWITVRAPSSAGPFGAHRSDLYRRTAGLVDHTADPALSEWRASAAPFLTAKHGRAWDFTVMRT